MTEVKRKPWFSKVIWIWHFFGDDVIVLHLPYEVSWWKRFWTKVFFGSKWVRDV